MGASGTSRLLGAAKLQSAPSADNPRYATDKIPTKDSSTLASK